MDTNYYIYIQVSHYLYTALLLVCVLIGIFHFKKLSAPFKVLTVFLALTFADEIISAILAVNKISNSLLYTLYTPFHFLLLSLVCFLLSKTKFNRTLIIIFAALYSLFYFIYLSNFSGKKLPFELILVDAFLLVCYSILGYYQLLQQPDENILKNSSFWFYNSIVIFFCGSFVHWLSYPFLLNQPISFTIKFYFLGWIMNLIQYSLMAKTLLVNVDKKS